MALYVPDYMANRSNYGANGEARRRRIGKTGVSTRHDSDCFNFGLVARRGREGKGECAIDGDDDRRVRLKLQLSGKASEEECPTKAYNKYEAKYEANCEAVDDERARRKLAQLLMLNLFVDVHFGNHVKHKLHRFPPPAPRPPSAWPPTQAVACVITTTTTAPERSTTTATPRCTTATC